MKTSDRNKNSDYDSEPVRYCPKCYSLKIRFEEAIGTECCMDCGCSDIEETTISDWERLYEQRYGHKFVQKDSNPRNHPIFRTTVRELKNLVYENPSYWKIIKRMYPKFPGGLGRADSVIMFFDKLSKDNRIDELRMLLLNV